MTTARLLLGLLAGGALGALHAASLRAGVGHLLRPEGSRAAAGLLHAGRLALGVTALVLLARGAPGALPAALAGFTGVLGLAAWRQATVGRGEAS